MHFRTDDSKFWGATLIVFLLKVLKSIRKLFFYQNASHDMHGQFYFHVNHEKKLHEWFYVNLGCEYNVISRDFLWRNYKWNIPINFLWIIWREIGIKVQSFVQFWKYVLNIAKQSSNILWMLLCFTSYSIYNCKFKSCLIILPRQLWLVEICLNRCCLKSIWTTFDYW